MKPDDLDQRIYNTMGKKLYEARRDLNTQGPEAAVYKLLDAMDDCYALLSTLFDPPTKGAGDGDAQLAAEVLVATHHRLHGGSE